MSIVGEDDDLAKEARVLNRIVRWHPRKGLTDEADPRHAEISVVTPEQRISLKRKRRDERPRRRRDKI